MIAGELWVEWDFYRFLNQFSINELKLIDVISSGRERERKGFIASERERGELWETKKYKNNDEEERFCLQKMGLCGGMEEECCLKMEKETNRYGEGNEAVQKMSVKNYTNDTWQKSID